MSTFTRRSFIGKTAVAIGSFAALQKVVGAERSSADRSRTDPGPANQTLDGQNPDSIWPPSTDSKSLVPNSIQGLNPDGCEFMLVFEDGEFSETETLLLSDAMAHLPPEVLSKNFGVGEQALKNVPKEELFIFQTDVPGRLEDDQKAAAGALGKSPKDFAFRTMEIPPTKRTKGGEVRIVDSSNFKVTTTAMAMVTVHPGGMRELHWHPNADEWQYYITGKGRMTVVATGNKGRTMDFQEGDVGYVQKTLLHYIENTGDTDLIFLEMFRAARFQEVSLSQWLTHTTPELIMAHLDIDKATLDAIPKKATVVMPV